MLKLTGGEFGGRTLKWLDTPTIRPTPARVREAVFNILATELDDSIWWDLCCGSGVVGFEALSRGAAKVVFVDENRRALQLLKDNLRQYGLIERAEVFCMDAVRWLKLRNTINADFIYCDPPYASRIYRPLIETMGALPLEPAMVTLLLEHRKGDQPWSDLAGWTETDTRHYGDTCLALLERRQA
ncbi:MAG: 16S rRNA (guanine(966)-N(2))-methyltransferase RsmD [Candidatus Melainabacteria bacterium HGW-Melainabacteria-1]|nr:MAG: 16S rRNA (guanine(966)-N(2))-methyltransferase RsmD [Candidatus Melainabacteria bacterium HGW-Melainabacteria-1]